jgi:predicted amidohydrolase YtcJ
MDKVIFNAKVYIERGKFAQAVLVRGEHIALAGTNEEVLALAGSGAERMDAGGCLLLPGFHDCHMHLSHFGRAAFAIPAVHVTSIGELVERGRMTLDRLRPKPGAVLTGWGWDQEQFTGEKRLPNRYDLDKISTSHAVIISRKCGHMVCCNSKALEMAGIGKPVPIVEGGQIDVDEAGEPTGIFRENAMDILWKIVPEPDDLEKEAQLAYAMRHALKLGLTAVSSQDAAGGDMEELIRIYARVYEKGLRLRVTQQAGIGCEAHLDEYIQRGYRTGTYLHAPFLKMGPLKLFADGSLGSRTALLRAPYKDAPETCGIRVLEPDVMAANIQKASQNGLQVAVHAIGDGAMDTVISSFEAVTREGYNPLRHGIIHCQITDRPLVSRMARNDLLALVQPIFLASDMHIAQSRVGRELASTSYAFGSMDRLHMHVAYSSDCPVETLNPLEGIACAVLRTDPDDTKEDAFFPDERVDVYTAVDSYTLGSAYAAFDEKRMGRVCPGYLADLVLLDRDIFTIPAQEIGDTQVLFTMVGGEIAYQKNAEG